MAWFAWHGFNASGMLSWHAVQQTLCINPVKCLQSRMSPSAWLSWDSDSWHRLTPNRASTLRSARTIDTPTIQLGRFQRFHAQIYRQGRSTRISHASRLVKKIQVVLRKTFHVNMAPSNKCRFDALHAVKPLPSFCVEIRSITSRSSTMYGLSTRSKIEGKKTQSWCLYLSNTPQLYTS